MTVLPPLLMLERSCLAMPVITAVSLGTSLLLPSTYVIVTLPLLSTAYSPGLMCLSLALEIRVTSPMLAALLITSPPDFRLVMLLSPRSRLPPVMLMLLPPKCIVGPPLLVMDVISLRSLFKEYVYVCWPRDVSISCLTVKFLPAA